MLSSKRMILAMGLNLTFGFAASFVTSHVNGTTAWLPARPLCRDYMMKIASLSNASYETDLEQMRTLYIRI